MRKITRILAVTLLGAGLAYGAAQAQQVGDGPPVADRAQADPVAAVMSAARVESLMQVVATEGARHGLGLEDSLFAGRGGASWASAVSSIQSPERLVSMVGATLRKELSAKDARAVARFLSGDLGTRIVAREVAARRDMLDGEVEAGARRAAAMMSDGPSRRADLIDEMIERLDLVGSNVSGGLNANFAFYRGLDDGGALGKRLTESEMIAMVWEQEDAVRVATRNWLRGYLTLAYAPFSEAELRTYVDFAESPAGRRYTSAMFAGFGRVFEATSYDLGRAAARFIAQDAI